MRHPETRMGTLQLQSSLCMVKHETIEHLPPHSNFDLVVSWCLTGFHISNTNLLLDSIVHLQWWTNWSAILCVLSSGFESDVSIFLCVHCQRLSMPIRTSNLWPNEVKAKRLTTQGGLVEKVSVAFRLQDFRISMSEYFVGIWPGVDDMEA